MSTQVTIAPPGQLLQSVRAVVENADESLLCVAFANEAGVRLIEPALKQAGPNVRLLATTVFGDTTAGALAHATSLGVRVRTLNLPRGTYHPKLYLGTSGGRMAALVGSANLTSGLLSNIEVGALLSGRPDEPPLVELRDLADSWWEHPAAASWTGTVAVPQHDAFVPDLWDQLRGTVAPGMTVLTLADGRPNQIAEMTSMSVWIETERSRALQRGPQEVPAWMFNIAWDYLVANRRLTNRTLLHDLNVHRSSLVCAVLAHLPAVDVLSRRPIELGLSDTPTAAAAAERAPGYHDGQGGPGP